ncbi:hypothetical protein BGZ65_002385 [Modicella reniformis]|uniref:Uncharacterized protein n=1 Tax=Modicella reniformis TaxID=1440133 RepID=A0A9P6SNM2_9FUNG|nr:hypothetical protein BGZ65_002385 [Modicella reniformis]
MLQNTTRQIMEMNKLIRKHDTNELVQNTLSTSYMNREKRGINFSQDGTRFMTKRVKHQDEIKIWKSELDNLNKTLEDQTNEYESLSAVVRLTNSSWKFGQLMNKIKKYLVLVVSQPPRHFLSR